MLDRYRGFHNNAGTLSSTEYNPAVRDQPNRDKYLVTQTFCFSLDDCRAEESRNAQIWIEGADQVSIP